MKGPPGRAPSSCSPTDEPAAPSPSVLERALRQRGDPPAGRRRPLSATAARTRRSTATTRAAGSYTDKRGRKGNNVYFSSIRGFKGLESPVVILCELDDLDDESRDNQLYVGISRARNHCVIVAPPRPT